MTARTTIRRLSLLLILPWLLAGCAELTKRPDPPQVSLAGLELLSFGLSEQRYAIDLKLDNPNSYALPISGLDYAIEVNGERFASGQARDGIKLPANGSETVTLDVTSNLAALIGQAWLLQGGKMPSVDYRLTGSMSLMGGLVSVPFDRSGEIRLTRE